MSVSNATRLTGLCHAIQHRAERVARYHLYIIEPKPFSESLQLYRQRGSDLPGVSALFKVSILYQQTPAFSLRLQVYPGDEAVSQTKRQHVVSPTSLWGRHIDLDSILEAEQA